MTKQAELPLTRTLGNGTNMTFAAGFELFALTDLTVELRDSDDALVLSVLNGAGTYDYIVAAYTYDAASDRYLNVAILFNTAPPSGYQVGMTRAGVQDQTLNLTAGGNLPAEALERRLDRLVALVQDLQAQVNRSALTELANDSVIDAGDRIIRHVADPVDIDDVVTKGFLTAGALTVEQIDGVTVTSIAALQALPVGSLNAATAIVTGYNSPGDGGGGMYFYDASSVFADDGVTCITASGGVGRWLLMPRNAWISDRQAGLLTSGLVNFETTNTAGAVQTMLQVDPDFGTSLYWGGGNASYVALETQVDGTYVHGIARARDAAVAAGDLLRKGEFDTGQASQDATTQAALAGKAALNHTHNYSLVARYVSANQTVTVSGALSHGLGAQPSPGHYGASLVCLAGNLGYVVGDRINLTTVNAALGGQFYAPSVWVNATQVGWALPTGTTTVLYIVPKGSGTPTALNAPNWAINVWAELVS